MSDRYFFQSPNDGHPMMLVERNGKPTVEACDCDDRQSCTELECAAVMDARGLTDGVKGCADLHSAARMLKRFFHCFDL